MKFAFLSILLLAALSCKKESVIQKNNPGNAGTGTFQESKNQTRKPLQYREGIFNFQTELCENKGYFDTRKYSEEQIEDTYILWHKMSGSLLSTLSVFNLNHLQKARNEKDILLAKLDQDFSEKKKTLENLKPVRDPYWENVKIQKLKELAYEYDFRKTEILAFSNPAALMNRKLPGECEIFAKALNSNETQMIEAWRKLREEMSRKNTDPQRIMGEFEERLHSSERDDFATIDLITFGWGNCMNDHIKRVEYDENMYKKFNALFTKIDSECDEP